MKTTSNRHPFGAHARRGSAVSCLVFYGDDVVNLLRGGLSPPICCQVNFASLSKALGPQVPH